MKACKSLAPSVEVRTTTVTRTTAWKTRTGACVCVVKPCGARMQIYGFLVRQTLDNLPAEPNISAGGTTKCLPHVVGYGRVFVRREMGAYDHLSMDSLQPAVG